MYICGRENREADALEHIRGDQGKPYCRDNSLIRKQPAARKGSFLRLQHCFLMKELLLGLGLLATQ